MASSGFTPGGQTAPAGWASFDDASFPPPPPSAATVPAGGFGGSDFECARLSGNPLNATPDLMPMSPRFQAIGTELRPCCWIIPSGQRIAVVGRLPRSRRPGACRHQSARPALYRCDAVCLSKFASQCLLPLRPSFHPSPTAIAAHDQPVRPITLPAADQDDCSAIRRLC
jgi:hypothetical protein